MRGLPALLIGGLLAGPLTAQGAAPYLRLSAGAVPSLTRVDGIPGGGSLSELKVVRPVLLARAGVLADHLRFVGTFNVEGWTMAHGELTPGGWGEGYMDRRHPHTYFHELVLSLVESLGPARASLSVGKGFAPFGTDDPMNRPPLRYPVNHHWSQILERAVAIAAVEAGPLILEGGLFNGDEPEYPGQWPRIGHRFGDSWSARLLMHPLPGLELQGSRAVVASPENRPGYGSRQYKWSLSARWDRTVKAWRSYALVEWARNSELEGTFVFQSVLAEAGWRRGRHEPYYRFERTERPEEERLLNLYRSIRPHLENSILGRTRWTIHTLGYGYTLPVGAGVRAGPFAEVSYARVRAMDGLFNPEQFYGRSNIWELTAGVRVAWGQPMARMGRYGVLGDGGESAPAPMPQEQ